MVHLQQQHVGWSSIFYLLVLLLVGPLHHLVEKLTPTITEGSSNPRVSYNTDSICHSLGVKVEQQY